VSEGTVSEHIHVERKIDLMNEEELMKNRQ
jgi:hypothetical protein